MGSPESRPAYAPEDPAIPSFLAADPTPVAAPRSPDTGFHTVGAIEQPEQPVFSFDEPAAPAYIPQPEAPTTASGASDTMEVPNFESMFNSPSAASTYTDLTASRPEPTRAKEPEPVRPPQKSKPSRMLPWFLQDNDSRYND